MADADGFSFAPVKGLRSPVLVMAFGGWSDTGTVSTDAAQCIIDAYDSERVLTVDPEEYFVFTDTRPLVRISEGDIRQIIWPENEIWAVRVPDASKDLIVVKGIEPNLRWRTFSRRLSDSIMAMEPSMGCTIGARPAPVPHTRPTPVNGSSADPSLAQRFGLGASGYQGPTGIIGVLHDDLRKAGLGLVSLFANVPHYLSIDENPPATLALLKALEPMTGVTVPAKSVEDDAETFAERVSEASGDNDQIQEYVRMLEQQYTYYEQSPQPQDSDLPPASDILKDVEDLLRGDD